LSKFQFRKRKKLAPGLYLNISKKGFGVSAGPKGAKISRSATGRVTGSVGIPGSGISYRERLDEGKLGESRNPEEDQIGLIQDIQDKASYISIHGNVLSSSEVRRALFYLGFVFLLSFLFPFSLFVFGLALPLLVIWALFVFLYVRESSRNKRRWKERTIAHLQVCEHNSGE
jgi:hypothetical protein